MSDLKRPIGLKRYYFDIREGVEIAVDEEGLALSNIQAAQEEAARSLAGITQDAVSSGLNTRHQMSIEVRDDAGPVLTATVAFAIERHRQQPNASSREVVLVVEDEALVRMSAVEMIQAAGFDVVEAVNADHAVQILERRADIRLIFTDIDMPGSMDGLRLAHLVKHRWPPIKIIATSGYTKPRDSELPEGSRFLAKPYAATGLATSIRELI